MTLSTLARLGRVSNLPTVWSNVFAGAAFASDAPDWGSLIALAAGFSASYTAGMFLNDAFDASFDRVHRPERPIPSGEISSVAVFLIGFGLLATGAAIVVCVAVRGGHLRESLVGSICLAVAIVLYDAWHKQNPSGPLIMAACRALVYVTTALAISGGARAALAPALAAFAYLVGLTAIAKRESAGRLGAMWPVALLSGPLWVAGLDRSGGPLEFSLAAALAVWIAYAISLGRARNPAIGRMVGLLIAGISLADALFISTRRAPALSMLAIVCFLATLMLQRRISGT